MLKKKQRKKKSLPQKSFRQTACMLWLTMMRRRMRLSLQSGKPAKRQNAKKLNALPQRRLKKKKQKNLLAPKNAKRKRQRVPHVNLWA